VVTTTGSNVLTAVHVSDIGEVKAHQVYNYLCIPFADKNQPENYKADLNKLENFILDSKAGLIVIGAN
jgi:hypothetical protein